MDYGNITLLLGHANCTSITKHSNWRLTLASSMNQTHKARWIGRLVVARGRIEKGQFCVIYGTLVYSTTYINYSRLFHIKKRIDKLRERGKKQTSCKICQGGELPSHFMLWGLKNKQWNEMWNTVFLMAGYCKSFSNVQRPQSHLPSPDHLLLGNEICEGDCVPEAVTFFFQAFVTEVWK